MTTISKSPLAHVFAGHADVPFAFTEQFLHGIDLPYRVRLEGVMQRIWHQPAVLRPLFWLLGKFGILVPHNGVEVPTTLDVRPGVDATDGHYHIWDRTFAFAKPVRFRTTIIYDRELHEVVDLVGPSNMLYMVWTARFHAPDRFTLDTKACALRIGRCRIWMPRWLWKLLLGTVAFSQRADSTDRCITHIELLIHHPIFGKVFGYNGRFRVLRLDMTKSVAELIASR